ncbi:MAG: phospho-N-acetylmuramoyl-pentapeptide-transferase [Lachnospiraceae bacterium]|nr:phospho-N-acetylmuramoyl-pentapeptide-transferase [Lachnospiraceae bacterium]
MKDAAWAGAIAFFLSVGLTPLLIPLLQRLKFGQVIREDGPQGHLKKAGTPTMGGIAFILSYTAAALIFLPGHMEFLPVLLVSLACGLIGFADDFLEIVKKKNEGLKPLQKLFLQILVAAAFCLYRFTAISEPTRILLPGGGEWTMPWWLYIPLFFLMFLGTDNGVNLNDGLDGLCASVTAVVAAFLAFLSLKYMGAAQPLTFAVAGALLGYLIYNVNPARLFMGDTGSLALGGFVAAAFITLRQPLLVLIAGFVYFAESLSVIIQRYYFKATHGKRFFRMTPIHHHFELGGWSEPRVVIVFTTVCFWTCVLAYLLA